MITIVLSNMLSIPLYESSNGNALVLLLHRRKRYLDLFPQNVAIKAFFAGNLARPPMDP